MVELVGGLKIKGNGGEVCDGDRDWGNVVEVF